MLASASLVSLSFFWLALFFLCLLLWHCHVYLRITAETLEWSHCVSVCFCLCILHPPPDQKALLAYKNATRINIQKKTRFLSASPGKYPPFPRILGSENPFRITHNFLREVFLFFLCHRWGHEKPSSSVKQTVHEEV